MTTKLRIALACAVCFSLVGCSEKSDTDTSHNEEDTDYLSDDYENNTNNESIEKKDFEIDDYFFNNNLRWNMSFEEAEDSITLPNKDAIRPGSNISGSSGYLRYTPFSSESVNADSNYAFIFPNGNLKTYFVQFDKITHYGTDYINLYNVVKQKVISVYGEPSTENYNWTDETYKSDTSEWDEGLKYGYLTIETQWLTDPNKDIVMRWSYKDGFYLIICEKGYIPYL